MEMSTPRLVLSRVKGPLVLLGDCVPTISSQVKLFSLQKKRICPVLLFGYSQLTVAPAALLTVRVRVLQFPAKRAKNAQNEGHTLHGDGRTRAHRRIPGGGGTDL